MKGTALGLPVLLATLMIVLLSHPSAIAHHTGDLYNCADFQSQSAAQAHYRAHPSDQDRLDANNDGVACEGSLTGPSDYNPVTQATSVPTVTGTPIVTATLPIFSTPIATATLTATSVAPTTQAPTATPSVIAPTVGTARWVDRPPTTTGGTATCPSLGQWLLLYWDGVSTGMATASAACTSADFFWSRQGDRWLGFSVQMTGASDTWTQQPGEVAFVHGR